MTQQTEKFAIRFGLGGIKAVGFNMMENAVKERKENSEFQNIYDFAERLDPKSINKKSIEALAKAGAFDKINKNRRQIAESFDLLSSYAAQKQEAALSNQMSLFGGLPEAESKPELRNVENWNKTEKLQKEFEAFGFFLNEHPVDDYLPDLRKRGVVFSDKLERDEFEDNNLIKMAGVICASKHRSGARGRFAYITISDPYGIFEAMIFDDDLITNARDLLADGSMIQMDCLIKKDDGGTRILLKDVKKLEDFIGITKAAEENFEDIKKQPSRNRDFSAKRNFNNSNEDFKGGGLKRFTDGNNYEVAKQNEQKSYQEKIENLKAKKIFSSVQIILKERDPIQNIKALLSQRIAPNKRIAPNNFEKFSKVSFCIMRDEKIFKVELPQKYLLDDSDISRLRSFEKIIDVEFL